MDNSENLSRSSILAPGTVAPDFSLESSPGQTVSLRDFRDDAVVLIFYPADWSPVCGSELALFNELVPTFDELAAKVLGISVDGAWCHAAFSAERKFKFPILADFEPKGAVARAYGVYRARDGTSERALYVIDRHGVVQWSYISPIDLIPGADGVLEALQALHPKTEETVE